VKASMCIQSVKKDLYSPASCKQIRHSLSTIWNGLFFSKCTNEFNMFTVCYQKASSLCRLSLTMIMTSVVKLQNFFWRL